MSLLSKFVDETAPVMISKMENHARQLKVKGVILVAYMDKTGNAWTSQMKSVDTIKEVPSDPENHNYPGYNFLGIAYSKAAEMADTKINSGSKVRAPYQGEFGYRGGVIHEVATGFILTVFSGASSEIDLEIAKVGMDAYQSKAL